MTSKHHQQKKHEEKTFEEQGVWVAMSARSYCHVEGKLWKLPSMHFQQRVHRSQGLHFTRPLLPQFSEHQQKTNNVRLAGNNGVG